MLWVQTIILNIVKCSQYWIILLHKIPLSHILGFCENYDRGNYGVNPELILQQNRTNDANQLLVVMENDSDIVKDG